jgi:hypothetical protein
MTLAELQELATPGNIFMASGAGLFALWQFKDKIVAKWQELFPARKPSTTSVTDDELLSNFSVHDIVEILIQERKEVGDDDGVMLIGTFGKHIYDFEMMPDEEEEDDDE